MKRMQTTKHALRKRRHARIRSRIEGTSARPRLAVHKSNRFVSAQLIDDVLSHRQEPAVMQAVTRKVAALADRFPLYPELRQ